MKKKLYIIFLILSIYFLNAQNLKLYYNLEVIHDTIANKKENKQMLLWIDKDSIVFSSNDLMIRDSISSGNNEQIYFSDNEIELMTITDKMHLYKYNLIDNKLYKTLEESRILNWQIKNDLKQINGFNCQLATVEYKGRKWEAWFDKSTPISYGPYIFHGLPGIIVQLNDSKKQYSFSLDKISKSKKTISESFLSSSDRNFPKALIVDNKQLKKLYLTLYSDPFRRMKEKKIIYMIDEKTGERQPPPNFEKMTKTAQKHIRDNNNPIEISEAIKYSDY